MVTRYLKANTWKGRNPARMLLLRDVAMELQWLLYDWTLASSAELKGPEIRNGGAVKRRQYQFRLSGEEGRTDLLMIPLAPSCIVGQVRSAYLLIHLARTRRDPRVGDLARICSTDIIVRWAPITRASQLRDTYAARNRWGRLCCRLGAAGGRGSEWNVMDFRWIHGHDNISVDLEDDEFSSLMRYGSPSRNKRATNCSFSCEI